MRRLVARFGEARLVMAGGVLLIAGFLGLRFADFRAASSSLAIATIALGIGVTTPTLSSLVSGGPRRPSRARSSARTSRWAPWAASSGPFAGENLYLRLGPDCAALGRGRAQAGALAFRRPAS